MELFRYAENTLSIVVPLYNEEESVALLYERLFRTLRKISSRTEVIFVDDGSQDDTWSKCLTLAENEPRLKLIRFRKNYGQTAAMAAGIDYAVGSTIITMDGDLQNDPEDIPLLLEEVLKGADMVIGWRHDRQDNKFTRKIPSVLANKLIGFVTGVPVKDNGCSLKAFRSELIKRLPLYADMHRFIPALTEIAGARIVEIKVRHHARQFGTSKYGLSRIYKVLLDLLVIKTIVKFSGSPLVWFSMMGVTLLPAFIASGLLLASNFAPQNEISFIVTSGLVTCIVATFAFLVGCGVLSELVVATGSDHAAVSRTLTFRTSNEKS